jgi:hypothetical protein
MRYQVKAPAKKVNDTIAGVRFSDSSATVDGDVQPGALAYFRRQGYLVEEIRDQEPTPPAAAIPGAQAAELPRRSASTEAWRAYAVDHGGMTSEEAAELSRDQLADRFALKEGDGQ